MKIIWAVGLFFCIWAHAERIICIDEELITQEIIFIMRSRGIEPIPVVAMQRAGAAHFLSRSGDTVTKRRLSRQKIVVSQQSISDLYAQGFISLQEGNSKEAFDFWHEVALRYPATDTEENIVKSALELAVQSRALFPIIKISQISNQPIQAGLFVLLPVPLSLLCAALLKG